MCKQTPDRIFPAVRERFTNHTGCQSQVIPLDWSDRQADAQSPSDPSFREQFQVFSDLWSTLPHGRKIERAQTDLAGDVKKLQGFKNEYRLRAGNYRVLLELEGPVMVVYDVGDRKDIYE